MLSPQARRSDSNLVASEGAGTGGSSGKGGLGWRMVSLVLLAWILLFGPFVSSVSKILFVPGEVGTSNIDRAVRRTRSVESNLTIYTRCYHYPTCRPIRCPVALIYRSSCPYSLIPLFPYSPFFPLSTFHFSFPTSHFPYPLVFAFYLPALLACAGYLLSLPGLFFGSLRYRLALSN